MARIHVIIPAYNEEKSIALVLRDIPKGFVEEVIVVNNNSSDNTAAVAAAAGATVLHEPAPGYGNACLKGIAYVAAKPPEAQPDIVVFLDGDYSDYPGEMVQLVAPIQQGQADLVIGSRALGNREPGAMLPQQIFGNWLATSLLRLFYGARFTDLGPFRAIRFSTLLALGMQDKTYGWTVEMQAKAARQNIPCTEVPVTYRKRIGFSKISGTVKGTIMAGYKIILTIFRYL
ncbi:glycosyltransferase family 2 protein [Pontibacter akesuensis]|uniref:Glycosyl transferase family 2 n=1 Tax=Pontibacter akesuensis TaxID=388950 RepID=A0A1I7KH40_9BACT|nr:glycosyltransferase family 2 protein [Pontibacter akesuensis]GHA79089.1 glycosyl hydrolase [Pontibacter akesuensis]SFU96750.1 Glycosyl transferase family 2 [Pontibacter akesuensis]